MKKLFNEVRSFLYRNAREVELSLWKYFFEDGSKIAVVTALMIYQNEDGGFGHALEADNWNPNSTPVTTEHALKILRSIDFMDMNHPIYQGIWKYLLSEKDLLDYGWRFTIPSNDDYPHAPWWNYSEKENEKEYYGVTAHFCAFILEYGDKTSALYHKAERMLEQLLQIFVTDQYFGDMGLERYMFLIDTISKLKMTKYDTHNLQEILCKKITQSIEHDICKWTNYGVRPSNYIKSPASPFYEANKEIVQAELKYLVDTKPEQDVWPITWTWFDNMDKYSKYFYVSENKWKCFKAIEKMVFLDKFGFEGEVRI